MTVADLYHWCVRNDCEHHELCAYEELEGSTYSIHDWEVSYEDQEILLSLNKQLT